MARNGQPTSHLGRKRSKIDDIHDRIQPRIITLSPCRSFSDCSALAFISGHDCRDVAQPQEYKSIPSAAPASVYRSQGRIQREFTYGSRNIVGRSRAQGYRVDLSVELRFRLHVEFSSSEVHCRWDSHGYKSGTTVYEDFNSLRSSRPLSTVFTGAIGFFIR